MTPFNVLFNPTVRVWNFRILVLWTLFGVVFWSLGTHRAAPTSDEVSPLEAGGIFTLCFIVFHQTILSLFGWPFKLLAIVDVTLTLLEIAGLAVIARFTWIDEAGLMEKMIFSVTFSSSSVTAFSLIPPMALLTLSAVFRIATITTSEDGILFQQFAFLGNCPRAYPPYTSLSILLNRSITRPLVRGESLPIIFIRAFIISCIALGLPAIATYFIVVQPLTTQIYTRSLVLDDIQSDAGSWPLTVVLAHDEFAAGVDIHFEPGVVDKPQIQCTTTIQNSTLPHFSNSGNTLSVVQCLAISWGDITTVSMSWSNPQFSVRPIYLTLVGGDLPENLESWIYKPEFPGVTLFPGSRLVGGFTWTQREIISKVSLGITSRMTVFTPDITGLQPDPDTKAFNETITTLTLFQQTPYTARHLQEAVDSTVLGGIANFGGFWTFVNGVFAIFFGANVLYFALGRRPLSALGLVHIFQRRRLERQWRADFPALHSEGGLPGSKSAGIVAFLRERLVDLGEEPEGTERESLDLEAQIAKVVQADDDEDDIPISKSQTFQHSKTNSATKLLETGYILDEIPLLDVDVGQGKVLKQLFRSSKEIERL
ncbi:Short-chain dehydrogenase/reductase family protein [Mycena venus]|uniref:Short-chain dehydrogenase/reductase family protein n=1 Tax=Mycena venus TaxID=2733690 RepID=A0A8H7DBV8_9AGAR|nr:Short-chain dehydrogenase/reductase family protein [Mycena venus]